jgi:hypothetical protein
VGDSRRGKEPVDRADAHPRGSRDGDEKKGKNKKRWVPRLEGEWRTSRIGGWEWEFGGVWKIKVHIEVPLELVFSLKPPNFGEEAHIEAPMELL